MKKVTHVIVDDLGGSMAISQSPSKLSLPIVNPGVTTVFEYLLIKFPYVSANIWQQRINDGKVHYHDGSLLTMQSPFQPQQRIYYYREVENEPIVPFSESILFQDQHILVAYKPHFLAVTPGGQYVNECLQNRLRERTGINTLQALHRLDRVTAGLVMFSVNTDSRALYHDLFENRRIHKTYQAVANIAKDQVLIDKTWQVKNHIENSEPRFTMRMTEDKPNNSHSIIKCIQQTAQQALFELTPVTGKTHQLRVHMQSLGWPIVNDKYYPHLQPLSEDDYSAPLQLLAKELKFIDPITQQPRYFQYEGNLSLF